MSRNTSLQNEFANDPEGHGYAGMTDQQRYDKLTLKDIPTLIPITSEYTSAYLETIGKWNQMNILSIIDQSANPPEPVNSTAFHMTLVLRTFEQFDMNNATQNQIYTNLVNSLVSNNIITQQQGDDLLSAGDSFESRDTEINVPNVTIGEVSQARI